MGLLGGIKKLFGGQDKPERYILDGLTDWHSHVLPGVDDGSPDMEVSLRRLDSFGRRGVRDLWLTPHIMEDFPNTTEHLRNRFKELCEAYTGPVQLHLASENMLDGVFAERLKNKDFLPIGRKGDMLLVETSYYTPPTGLDEMLFSIRSAGLTPLLAHPERYRYMDFERYRELSRQGVKMQLNLMSLMGHYGPEAKAKAKWLAKEGMYFCTGSDIHHPAHIPILDMVSPRMATNLQDIASNS